MSTAVSISRRHIMYDPEEPARWACKILLKKAYGRRVPPEDLDLCISIMKDALNSNTSIHDVTRTLSQMFNLRYDEVEKIVIKARKKAGII